MAFDWMTTNGPKRGGGDTRKSLYADEVRSRAALLRRLGVSKADARRRVVSTIEEEFSSFGASPLLKKEIDALLAEVYA